MDPLVLELGGVQNVEPRNVTAKNLIDLAAILSASSSIQYVYRAPMMMGLGEIVSLAQVPSGGAAAAQRAMAGKVAGEYLKVLVKGSTITIPYEILERITDAAGFKSKVYSSLPLAFINGKSILGLGDMPDRWMAQAGFQFSTGAAGAAGGGAAYQGGGYKHKSRKHKAKKTKSRKTKSRKTKSKKTKSRKARHY